MRDCITVDKILFVWHSYLVIYICRNSGGKDSTDNHKYMTREALPRQQIRNKLNEQQLAIELKRSQIYHLIFKGNYGHVGCRRFLSNLHYPSISGPQNEARKVHKKFYKSMLTISFLLMMNELTKKCNVTWEESHSGNFPVWDICSSVHRKP